MLGLAGLLALAALLALAELHGLAALLALAGLLALAAPLLGRAGLQRRRSPSPTSPLCSRPNAIYFWTRVCFRPAFRLASRGCSVPVKFIHSFILFIYLYI